MANTTMKAELPPELTARALSFVKEGWASGFIGSLIDALRRFLEYHPERALPPGTCCRLVSLGGFCVNQR